MTDQQQDTVISVRYSAECPNCGTTNVTDFKPMKLVDFNRLLTQDPKTYWKEDKAGKTEYRMHEEDSSARCRRSC